MSAKRETVTASRSLRLSVLRTLRRARAPALPVLTGSFHIGSTFNRVGDTSTAASVDYFTSDVTASERKDYITAIGELHFAGGETSKSFVVLINDDSFVEGNETFNVNLRNPAGATLGAPAVGHGDDHRQRD